MKLLAQIVTEHLKHNRRLIVPNLGAFIVKASGEVIFSPLLRTDDGVLLSLLRAAGESELEAEYTIQRFVFEVRYAVDSNNTFKLEGVGEFYGGENHTLLFTHTPKSKRTSRTTKARKAEPVMLDLFGGIVQAPQPQPQKEGPATPSPTPTQSATTMPDLFGGLFNQPVQNSETTEQPVEQIRATDESDGGQITKSEVEVEPKEVSQKAETEKRRSTRRKATKTKSTTKATEPAKTEIEKSVNANAESLKSKERHIEEAEYIETTVAPHEEVAELVREQLAQRAQREKSSNDSSEYAQVGASEDFDIEEHPSAEVTPSQQFKRDGTRRGVRAESDDIRMENEGVSQLFKRDNYLRGLKYDGKRNKQHDEEISGSRRNEIHLNKNTLIVIIVVALVMGIILWWILKPSAETQQPSPTTRPTLIEQEHMQMQEQPSEEETNKQSEETSTNESKTSQKIKTN